MIPKVLFVETDTNFLHNLAHRLRGHGLEVHESSTVDGVLKKIRDHEVGVILLDLEGLQNQGIELLKTIKAEFPRAEVIVIHGPEQVSLSIEAMKQGTLGDLSVPFDLEELLELIRLGNERFSISFLAG